MTSWYLTIPNSLLSYIPFKWTTINLYHMTYDMYLHAFAHQIGWSTRPTPLGIRTSNDRPRRRRSWIGWLQWTYPFSLAFWYFAINLNMFVVLNGMLWHAPRIHHMLIMWSNDCDCPIVHNYCAMFNLALVVGLQPRLPPEPGNPRELGRPCPGNIRAIKGRP